MSSQTQKTHETAMIAIGVATLIGGGLAIYIVSSAFPLPGIKYVIMAPFISTVLFVVQSKLKTPHVLLKFGLVFAMIMTLVNLFMGIAILVTTLATYISVAWIANLDRKHFWGSVLYSTFTGLFALWVSKLMIGGIFEAITPMWILAVGILSTIFGWAGTTLAKRIFHRLTDFEVEDKIHNKQKGANHE